MQIPWPQVGRSRGRARLSTVLCAGVLVGVCALMPAHALGQQLAELCAQNNGTWLEKFKECEYTSSDWCHRAGGQFDECRSACRHEVNSGPCTMQCVPVCKFATHMIDKDAANSESVIRSPDWHGDDAQGKAGPNPRATKASASDHERMFGVIPTHAITNDKNAPLLRRAANSAYSSTIQRTRLSWSVPACRPRSLRQLMSSMDMDRVPPDTASAWELQSLISPSVSLWAPSFFPRCCVRILAIFVKVPVLRGSASFTRCQAQS